MEVFEGFEARGLESSKQELTLAAFWGEWISPGEAVSGDRSGQVQCSAHLAALALLGGLWKVWLPGAGLWEEPADGLIVDVDFHIDLPTSPTKLLPSPPPLLLY